MPDCLDCGARWPEGTRKCPDDGSVLVDASNDPYIGKQIGSYIVSKCLGRGGMGAVYAAEHPTIGGRVAIKFLHRRYAGDPQIIDRFFNEARAVNIIGHDNIVRVTDFNRADDGSPYFIMEFLDGQSLAGLIDVAQPLSVTGPIVLQIAEGLLAAHEKGIVHRDLKPDNIFLVTRGRRANFVKIVDFGIAKLQGGGGALGHTQTGMVMGTAQYMSPEQAGGETNRISPASDIYSLGVIMFQLATGRLPFDGTSFGEVLVGHLVHSPPDPRSIEPSIPESYAAVILRCLEKKPEDRFSSMEELYDTLGDVLDAEGISRDLPLAYTGSRSDPAASKPEPVKRASAPPWHPPSISINDDEDGYTAVTTPAPVASRPPVRAVSTPRRPSTPDGTVLLTPSQITNSGPAPVQPPASQGSSKGLVALAVVVVLLVGAGAAWAFLKDSPPPPSPSLEVVEVPAKPLPRLPVTIFAIPEDAMITVVQRDERYGGRSPFTLSLVENVEANVTIEGEGYEPLRSAYLPTKAGDVHFELQKIPEPEPPVVVEASAPSRKPPPAEPPRRVEPLPPPLAKTRDTSTPRPKPPPAPKEKTAYGDDFMPLDF